MFSNWFSGDDLKRYRTSPHKQRIDAIASGLLRVKYASEVIRQHLHEWLNFSRTLDVKEATALLAPSAEAVRHRPLFAAALLNEGVPDDKDSYI